MNTVLENLQKARDLIAKPENWVRGIRHCPAAEGDGSYAHCALGAIEAALGPKMHWNAGNCTPEVVALAAVVPQSHKATLRFGMDSLNECVVATYNNATNHEAVVALFDRAIEIQKEHPTEKVG